MWFDLLHKFPFNLNSELRLFAQIQLPSSAFHSMSNDTRMAIAIENT